MLFKLTIKQDSNSSEVLFEPKRIKGNLKNHEEFKRKFKREPEGNHPLNSDALAYYI